MIIDVHSHLGRMINWPEAEIADYYNTMKRENIDIGILFPLPYQVDFDNLERVFLKYTLDGKTPAFSSDVLDSLKNPYRIINEHYYNIINSFRPIGKEILFVPIIHPILDEPDMIQTMIARYDPPALKVHGTGSGVVPSDFSSDLMEIIRVNNLPLIIHTEYSRIDNLNYIDKSNSALNWARWAVENHIKVCLAHGARLQPEALRLVNESDFLCIGIAPIQRVSRNSNRLESELPDYSPEEYLKFLRDHVDHRKILFDLDYNWNRIPNSNIPDYSASSTVKSIFGPESDLVLFKNAISFFSKLSTRSLILS